MITIQDTIKKAMDIKGSEILMDKKRLCILLEDLSPNLKEERDFIEKVYSDGIGKIIYDIYSAEEELRMEYIYDADMYLEENYGFNEKWRKRLLSYFIDRIPCQSGSQNRNHSHSEHKAVFRILSQGEEKREMEIFVGNIVNGRSISKNLSFDSLLKILYNEKTKEIGIKNISLESWTVVCPDFSKKECSPGQIQVLKKDMMIRIIPRVAQLNVIDVK